MTFMKGDLLTRTRKLVKGLAKAETVWLKAMEQAPPATFPQADGTVKTISLPEDVYIKKFFQKHPDSKYEDAIKFCSFVIQMEYRAEKKTKKVAYARLKQIARRQGKRPPPNPNPSAIKEIQAEERKHVHDRLFNPRIIEIAQRVKEDRAAEIQDRMRGSGW